MKKRLVAGLLVVTLPFGQVGVGVAWAEKIKYEKTEVEKARGKCVKTVLGGALLGGLIGRATGKGGTLAGAGIGAAVGVGACAVIMANAKRADRIIAAQIASARYQQVAYTTTFPADDGSSMTMFEGKGGASESIDAARLRPVRYMTLDGIQAASPVLAAGRQDCRAVSSSIGGTNEARVSLPTQYFCRTPEGDYQPYDVTMAENGGERKKAA